MSTIYQPRGRAGEYSEWALNLYAGCNHGCVYCYVPGCRRITKEQFYGTHTPYKDILKKLAKDAEAMRGTIDTPVMLSFTSDPYQQSEQIHQVTRQAIQILKHNGFKVCILTKAGMRATADFDILGAGDVMASSLTLLNEDNRRKWEPNAEPFDSRLDLLKAAKANGMMTWASYEPTIYPDQTLKMIELANGWCDLAKIGMLNGYPQWTAKIDWAGFAREAVALCGRIGQRYMVKDDLYKYVAGEFPQRSGEEYVPMHKKFVE
jgi:DNA repair photolyase